MTTQHDEEPRGPTLPPIPPQLAAAVAAGIETLVLASPRSPRAVEARHRPDDYVELYARAILGAPLAAIPVAVTRLTASEEFFPSVPRFVSEVRSVARQYFRPAGLVPPTRRDPNRSHCCGSLYEYRELDNPHVRVGSDASSDRPHRYARILCDCEVRLRIEQGHVLVEGDEVPA